MNNKQIVLGLINNNVKKIFYTVFKLTAINYIMPLSNF